MAFYPVYKETQAEIYRFTQKVEKGAEGQGKHTVPTGNLPGIDDQRQTGGGSDSVDS